MYMHARAHTHTQITTVLTDVTKCQHVPYPHNTAMPQLKPLKIHPSLITFDAHTITSC